MNTPNHSTSLAVAINSTLVMSSREIADLTEKKHSHVLRDIRVMLEQIHGKIDGPTLDHVEIKGIFVEYDNRGYVSVYHLDKDHTFTLIAGYQAAFRFKIVQRWQELESGGTPAELAFRMASVQLEHDKRLTLHDERLNQLDRRQTLMQEQIAELSKPRARRVAVNPDQEALDFDPTTPRERVYQGGTHASPRPHERRGHHRQISEDKRIWVRPTHVGHKTH